MKVESFGLEVMFNNSSPGEMCSRCVKGRSVDGFAQTFKSDVASGLTTAVLYLLFL